VNPLWLFLPAGCVYVALAGFTEVPMLLLPHRWHFQAIFAIAVVIHVAEGLYAVSRARKASMSGSACLLWFVQTFIYGFPSLLLLNDTLRRRK